MIYATALTELVCSVFIDSYIIMLSSLQCADCYACRVRLMALVCSYLIVVAPIVCRLYFVVLARVVVRAQKHQPQSHLPPRRVQASAVRDAS